MPENKKTILVIDDEELIRELMVEIIHSLGFEVETAVNGIDGLEKLTVKPDYDLIVLDMNMPGMDGRTSYHEIRKKLPVIKIILCSGLDKVETERSFSPDPNLLFVQKPYSLAIISSTIREALK